jgi:hypothetical protein
MNDGGSDVNGDGVLVVIQFSGRSVCHVCVPVVIQRGSGGGYGRLETAGGDNSDDTILRSVREGK